MKVLRWMAVPVLAVSTVACGSSSDSGGSTEEWCDVATGIEEKFNSIGDAFGGTADEIKALFDDITTELDDAVGKAPSEIADEVKLTQKAVADMKGVLADADYNILDVDQGALQDVMGNEDMAAASDKISAFNEKECGIPDTTDATGDSTADTLGEGTARDQIVTSLQAIGLTEDEATCVAENIDPALAAQVGSDPTQMMAVFEKCDIGLERLAQLGVRRPADPVVTGTRFDAVLFDAGGVLVLPDPVAIGDLMEPYVGSLPHHRFRRAHHAGLRALEAPIVDHAGISLESLDWDDYLRGYARALGVGDGHLDEAVVRFGRIFTSYVWRYRIEESVAAMNVLALKGVQLGVVSNASGQIEAALRYGGVCQVGTGAGVPVVCVVDSEVVGVAKPDPAIFTPALDALAALGIDDRSRIAYVGDSAINDVGGAIAAGLVPLQLDPFDDYPGVAHERITSVWDLVDMVRPTATI